MGQRRLEDRRATAGRTATLSCCCHRVHLECASTIAPERLKLLSLLGRPACGQEDAVRCDLANGAVQRQLQQLDAIRYSESIGCSLAQTRPVNSFSVSTAAHTDPADDESPITIGIAPTSIVICGSTSLP